MHAWNTNRNQGGNAGRIRTPRDVALSGGDAILK
ncbi:hypothetical protein BN1263410011 [Stenotrophomonas indicatrix]|nr:hypothetical protein BN1263410011 [Stenotrophomonas indicatrix]